MSRFDYRFEPTEYLSEQEEQSLWLSYVQTRDPVIRERLIENYMVLVYQTAERIAKRVPAHIDIQDLISSGNIGLLDAIDMFDPSRGIKFSTYCNQRIYGSIIDEFRRLDWAPRLVRTRVNQLERAKEELESRLGRQANDEEIASHLNLTSEQYEDLLKETQVRTMVSLDRKWDESDDHELGPIEMLPDTRATDPLSDLTRAEIKEIALKGLSDYQKKVLILYYYENLNLKEIGAVLELSESRVCQIHAQTLEFLKNKFTQREISPVID